MLPFPRKNILDVSHIIRKGSLYPISSTSCLACNFTSSATIVTERYHRVQLAKFKPGRITREETSQQRRLLGHLSKQSPRERTRLKGLLLKGTQPPQNQHSISQAELSHYTKTNPPSDAELSYASQYFSAPARELSPIQLFRHFPRSEVPEVTVLGRSNVGKSSLLNALLGRQTKKDPVAAVSKRPGKTRSMNAIGLQGAEYSYKQKLWFGKTALVLVDMPGYGFGSRAGWGEEIIKYLTKREQLCRSFLLIDAHSGIQPSDEQILSLLTENNLPFSLILSKVDIIIGTNPKVPPDLVGKLRSRLQEIQQQVADIQNKQRGGRYQPPDILGSSSEPNMTCGMNGIRWAMLESTEAWNTKNERKQLRPAQETR